jgi:hypothetical protein
MRLSAAARFFDRVVFADAYTPYVTFKGQLNLFDDSTRDGVTETRRVLSVAADVDLPVRNAVSTGRETFLVGEERPDYFGEEVIRLKYPLQKAQGLATLLTPAQALSTGGTSAYASKIWLKDAREQDRSSDLAGFFNIYLSHTESAADGSYVRLANKLHKVRSSYLSAAGFLVLEASELAADKQTATYKTRTFSSTTGGYTSVDSTVQAIQFRYQDDFSYESEDSATYAVGDSRAVVLKSAVAAAKVGDRIVLSDGTKEIVSVRDEGLCWGLHLRHA